MSDEIEKALEEVENIQEDFSTDIQITQETKELTKDEIDVEEVDSIAEGLVNMVKDDRKKADEIFDLFYTNLGMGHDRSESSKEAITKALELRIEASKNLIELLKVKSKISQVNNKVGILFETMSEKKTGIRLSDISEEDLQDDE